MKSIMSLPGDIREPGAMAMAVGIDLTRYVDTCFPDVTESFEEIIIEIARVPVRNLADLISSTLFHENQGSEILRGLPTFFYFPALCAAYAHDAIVAEKDGDLSLAWASVVNAAYWLGIIKGGGVYDDISRDIRKIDARRKADLRHSKPNGSREKRQLIKNAWASGKYSSRDICAEQECAALEMSLSTARKALRGTPDPT